MPPTTVELLEREDELAAVEALLDDTARGDGRVLMLEGAPGAGKSTLVHEGMRRAAGREVRVLRAAGRELERGLGWGVARALLEPPVLALPPTARGELLAGPVASARPLIDPDPDAGGRPSGDVSFGILHGLHWLARRLAEEGPLLIVVDDAHWADAPSLRFLHYLAGRLAGQPLGLLIAARAGEPGADGLLPPLAAAAEIRELAPLSTDGVAAIVRGQRPDVSEDLARRCAALTGGNPMQLRALLAAMGDGGDLGAAAARAARSLSRTVLARLEAMPPDARRLARAVAVLEGDAPVPRAAGLAGVAPAAALTALDELARADILVPGDPLDFVHPLIRAAVYEGLAPSERARMHREAGRLLVAAGAPSPEVAAHLERALPAADPDVVDALRDAARAAMAQGVPDSAAAYLKRALREPPLAADRLDVLAELGRAEAPTRPRAAVAHFEAALSEIDDPVLAAALSLELGRALHDAGRPADACLAFDRGLARLGDEGGELGVELEAWYLTSAYILPERAPAAHARVESLLDGAAAADAPARRALLSKAVVMRVYEGMEADRLAALALELWAGGRLMQEGGIDSQAVGHVVGTLSYTDRYAETEEIVARVREETRRRGWITWYGAVTMLRARQRLWTGPVPDALEDAQAAAEIFRGGTLMYLPAALYGVVCALIEGDRIDEAEALAAEFAAARPVGAFMAWASEADGRVAAARGDHERAHRAFLASGEAAGAALMANPSPFHWRSLAALSAARLGRHEEARSLVADELRRAERFGAPRARGVARRATGLLARGEEAVAMLGSAAALHEAAGARLEHARSLAALGGAVRRAGRETEARDRLREAIALADELGAVALAREARDELRRAGGKPPVRRDERGGLTPSERRVAELAAAGRTNREIADELFVTVKAVEWHLGNCYRKLDIRGRRELGTALGAS